MGKDGAKHSLAIVMILSQHLPSVVLIFSSFMDEEAEQLAPSHGDSKRPNQGLSQVAMPEMKIPSPLPLVWFHNHALWPKALSSLESPGEDALN